MKFRKSRFLSIKGVSLIEALIALLMTGIITASVFWSIVVGGRLWGESTSSSQTKR